MIAQRNSTKLHRNIIERYLLCHVKKVTLTCNMSLVTYHQALGIGAEKYTTITGCGLCFTYLVEYLPSRVPTYYEHNGFSPSLAWTQGYIAVDPVKGLKVDPVKGLKVDPVQGLKIKIDDTMRTQLEHRPCVGGEHRPCVGAKKRPCARVFSR